MRLLHHHGATADKAKGTHHFWNTGTGTGLLYPTMLIAAIAVIGFSLFGIATMTGYLPNLVDSDEAEVASSPSAAEPAVVACANCGVISSMHPIEKTSAVNGGPAAEGAAGRPSGRGERPQSRTAPQRDVHYQIKVHMSDGSYRSFDYGTAPQVTIGQRVKVIDGRIIAGD